jgi:hypothetical protein
MIRRLLLLSPVFFLAACGSTTVRDTLGISRSAPDEFRVLPRPPLSVPPEFNLRPPAAPGEANTGAQAPARDQAQSLITGTEKTSGSADTAVTPVTSSDLQSGADTQFLRRAGADQADTGVRAALRQEYDDKHSDDKSMLDKIREPSENQPVVDAQSEAERLKANKDAGKPATEGDTPMQKDKDTGTLGKIFGY